MDRPEDHVRPPLADLPPPPEHARRLLRSQPRRPPRHARHLRRRRAQRDVHLRRPRHLRRRLRPHLHRRHHDADELAARSDHARRDPRNPLRHKTLPRARARQLPPPAHRHRQDQLLHPGVRLRHVSRAALQPRAPRLQRLLRRQRRKQARLDRRHLRLRALLPGRRVPKLARHRDGHLVRRPRRALLCIRPHPRPLARIPRPRLHTRHRTKHGLLLRLRRRYARHADGLHPVRAALLPPDPGPQRQVQHPASRDGRSRAHLPPRRHSPRHLLTRRSRAPATVPAASSSATSGSPTRSSAPPTKPSSPPHPIPPPISPRSNGSSATSASPSTPTRPPPSSATPAQAKPRSPR